jgi:mono/diheme cytochrome c family protein
MARTGRKNSRSFAMMKVLRSQIVLAAAVSLAGAMCFAQDGAAIYKSKCQMCHGPNGTPSAGMAKMLGIPAVTSPAVKKLTVDEVMATVEKGHGKMHPITGLSDAQVKAVAAYFKTLK